MRELKEASIKKIFSKEALDMKIIALQISTSTIKQTMILSFYKRRFANKLKIKTKPSIRVNTLIRLQTIKLKMPKTSRDSASSTKKYITSFFSKAKPSPKVISSKNTTAKSKKR
jgi:hypothetical protein